MRTRPMLSQLLKKVAESDAEWLSHPCATSSRKTSGQNPALQNHPPNSVYNGSPQVVQDFVLQQECIPSPLCWLYSVHFQPKRHRMVI